MNPVCRPSLEELCFQLTSSLLGDEEEKGAALHWLLGGIPCTVSNQRSSTWAAVENVPQMGYNSMALSQLPQHPLLRQHPTPAAYDVSKKIPTEGRSTGRWQRCGLHIQEAARAQDAPSKQFRLLLCTMRSPIREPHTRDLWRK